MNRATCAMCGAEIEKPRTGPAPKHCPPCKAKHRAKLGRESYQRTKPLGPVGAVCTCRICGERFVARARSATVCHERACRREFNRMRAIEHSEALAARGIQCHCGKPIYTAGLCKAHYQATRRAVAGRQERPKLLECAACGEPVLKATRGMASRRPVCSNMCRYFVQYGRWQASKWVNPADARRAARQRAAVRKAERAARGSTGRTWYSGRCRECGAIFTTDRPQARTCSDRCSVKAPRARRRARKKDAFVSPVYRLHIFERDKWTCQLCGRKLKRGAEVPHPLAPTIDHIIPLGDNGTHEPANCQAAHFRCNSRKRDRGGGEQLALVG